MAVEARGRRRAGFTRRAATALIALLFVLFVVVLAVSILRERNAATVSAETRAAAASQVVATNARWITELSRQALGRIDEALGPVMEDNAQFTDAVIRRAVENLPGNVKAYVVAADGRTLFSTDPHVRPIDIRDREYFAAVADGAGFHVSPLLVSRLDGAQIFVFSKRVERGGRFVGAAIISFDVALLREIWASLALDDASTVSFIRDDGQLVARYPFADAPLDLGGYVLFTDYLKIGDEGVYPALSPADGVTRIVGYRRVPGTPLVAVASVSTISAFAQFRRNTLITLGFAVPTALALAAAIFWIFRLLGNDERRRAELVAALDLNHMLVRDTHHRVKNNLQSIMSLVRLHRLPEELKWDLQRRVSAMTAVHEHLYRLDKFAEVDAATLIAAIAEPLSEAFALPVTIEYDVEHIVLDHDHATPLALIVNEVVTNALKYAFPDGREGTIRIEFRQRDASTSKLVISDDGVGFDPAAVGAGLGGRLVRALLMQLGSDGATYSFDGGSRFEADLKLVPSDAADERPRPFGAAKWRPA